MKKLIYHGALLLGAIYLASCTVKPSETGTYDKDLDAEVREIHFHDQQLALLGVEIDSLQALEPRTDDQNTRLSRARERKSWHEAQREEAIRRANQRGQEWNILYNQDKDWRQEDQSRRQP
jgi:hypothetical protein